MDTPLDVEAYEIEKKIRSERALVPCDDYKSESPDLEFCDRCGWDHEEHDEADA